MAEETPIAKTKLRQLVIFNGLLIGLAILYKKLGGYDEEMFLMLSMVFLLHIPLQAFFAISVPPSQKSISFFRLFILLMIAILTLNSLSGGNILDFKPALVLLVAAEFSFGIYIFTLWKANKQHTQTTSLPHPHAIEKHQILFLAASPTNLSRLQVDKEYKTVKQYLKNNSYYELLMPEFAVTVENMVIAMNQKPEIIHFSGHGKEKGIMISTDTNERQLMPTAALKRLFKQHVEDIQLVLLNSCYSEEQAKIISELGMVVIGMNDPIGDSAAIDFASGLYIGLSEGKSIKSSFDDAMIILSTKHPEDADLPKVWQSGKNLDW